MTDLLIAENTQVTLHFSLKLEDGSLVDSNFEGQPATFSVGDGSLLQGFEKKLMGMKAGENGQFQILPEEAFGQPNPNNVQQFNRGDFADDMELAEGMVISFADASQSELPGVVKAFDDSHVTVDFNHPLAGRTIQFDVSIIQIKALTDE